MTIDLDDLAERLEDAAERVPAVPPERHVHLDLLVRRLERFLDAADTRSHKLTSTYRPEGMTT